MYLTSDVKKELFEKHSLQKTSTDTGSPESQVALFTYRINSLNGHLKQFPKDKHTRQGLLKLVGKRKRLLHYLQNEDVTRYRSLIAALGIRK
jgi:small subunit ribosomal protein S15